MRKLENYLIDFTEAIAKEGHSIIEAGVKTFFKSKGELATYTIDNYMNARFAKRLEYFAFEQEKLSNKEKKDFFDNINYKNLNYLFEMLDKARTNTYDVHARILAVLTKNLTKNGKLNYYESSLLSNINTLNEIDFTNIFNIITNEKTRQVGNGKSYEIFTTDESIIISISKLSNIGIVQIRGTIHFVGEYTTVQFSNSKFFNEFIDILKEVLKKVE